MDERPDLEGRERFLDSIDEPEPIEPPFIAGGPYDVDLGMVPETESTRPSEGIAGKYASGGEQPSPTADDLEAQRAQVEETRAEMSDTIDAIQEKLSPGNLAQQAKETVKGATVGKVQDTVSTATDSVQQAASTASTTAQDAAASAAETAKGLSSAAVETVKHNPVPAALVGIGLGWLIVSAREKRATRQSPPTSYRSYSSPYAPPRASGQETAGPVGQAVNQAQDTVSQVAGQAQDTAQQAVTQASQLGTQVQQRARQTVGGFQCVMQQNPLAVGAVGVALGLAIGLAIPETQREDQLLGQTRESFMEKAQQTAQNTAQKVKTVAQEALGTAKEEAKKQGLSEE